MGQYRELDDMMQRLAEERVLLKLAELERKQAEEAMLLSDLGAEYRAKVAAYDSQKGSVASAEQLVREAIVEIYEETDEKHPAKGADVRVYRVAKYDTAIATEWCSKNAPALLTLDRKAFEKSNLPNAPITWEDDPRPSVASDLSSYIDLVDEEPAIEIPEGDNVSF